jgi:hypothetical protein
MTDAPVRFAGQGLRSFRQAGGGRAGGAARTVALRCATMGGVRTAPASARDAVEILAALPALAMRRAVLAERLAALDAPAAATLIEGIVARVARCERGSQIAAMALASWQLELRDGGRAERLREIAEAAARLEHRATAVLCGDAPAHKALHHLGRLAEVCMSERRSLHVDTDLRLPAPGWCGQALLHRSPVMASRLLDQRWMTLRQALVMASRRPTSPAIAFAVARSERWMRHTALREALALNPFTPTGLALALLPTLRWPVQKHLRDAGDVHPLVAEAARCFLELRC